MNKAGTVSSASVNCVPAYVECIYQYIGMYIDTKVLFKFAVIVSDDQVLP